MINFTQVSVIICIILQIIDYLLNLIIIKILLKYNK